MRSISDFERALNESGRLGLTKFPNIREIRYYAAPSDTGMHHNVDLLLEADNCDQSGMVHLRFSNVKQFKISSLGGGVSRLVGLSVANVSQDGWEDVNWRVHDFENGVLSLFCNKVEVVSFEPELGEKNSELQ